jgi:hypothetical protein
MVSPRDYRRLPLLELLFARTPLPSDLGTTPSSGRSTQTLANGLGTGGAKSGFNPLYQIGGPRSIELALKLTF